MNGNRVVALSLWNFGYIIVVGTLLAFSAAGDCLQGVAGAAFLAQSHSFTEWLLFIAMASHVIHTLAIFFRRC